MIILKPEIQLIISALFELMYLRWLVTERKGKSDKMESSV